MFKFGIGLSMSYKKTNKSKNTKNTKKKKSFKFRYSFLTLVLLGCLAYVGVSAFYNISKTINYQGKIRKMEQLKFQAAQENIRLKEELENFNSLDSLEAIARNNLKMAGEDEVLVIINQKEDTKQEVKQDTNSFKNKLFLKKNLTERKSN